MDAASMLDVIHVFFEEDLLPTWEGGAQIKDEARKSIYAEMYGVQYKYGFSSAQGRDADFGDAGMYGPPEDGSIKPYIPPTDPQELVNMLGPPVG